jgi:hypothetical protein
MAKEKLEKPICSHCGSDNIRVDAYSSWNIGRQDWEHTSEHGNHVCEGACGGECSIDWVAADYMPTIEDGYSIDGRKLKGVKTNDIL